MSFSTAYDTLKTVIGSYFIEKTIIKNPYSLEDNINNNLNDGWGLSIGAGSVLGEFSIQTSQVVERSFSISLVRKYNDKAYDNASRVNKEKQIVADAFAIIAHLKQSHEIKNLGSIDSISDSGVEFLLEHKFLTFTITFNLNYYERS